MSRHNKLKVIHLHTDPKFVYLTEVFDKAKFENTIMIINGNGLTNELHYDQVEVLSSSKHDLEKAIQICSDVNIVVLYDLDVIKSYIALSLPQSSIVAWRFFGYELYGRRVESYLSEKSLPLHLAKKRAATKSLKVFFTQLKFRLFHGQSQDVLFADARKRVDLLLCLSKYEYDHLIEHWPDLPRFVQLPTLEFPLRKQGIIYENAQKKAIIVGNNRGIYNNHIDIIDLIEHSSCDEQWEFLVPFSYGRETPYSSEVRRRVAKSPKNFCLLEDFIAREAYFELLAKAKAAVFNSYRQMAMGNIFTLLGSGVKIYLNTQNVIYHWLIDLGLRVFTIEDFKSDLETDNLELGETDQLENANILERLQLEFNREKFASEIISFTRASHR